jgi:hypothetical protein
MREVGYARVAMTIAVIIARSHPRPGHIPETIDVEIRIGSS